MRAALEWTGAFLGAGVLSFTVTGALAFVLGRQPSSEAAVRFDESYDVPYASGPAGPGNAVSAHWNLEIDGVSYRSLELAAPHPLNGLRLSVEGASGHFSGGSVAPGGPRELELVLPKDTWAGVEVEIACAP